MDVKTTRTFERRINEALLELELQAIEAELWGFWTDCQVLKLRQQLEARRRALRTRAS